VQYRQAFVNAGARWSSVIVGNLEEVTITEAIRDDTACLNLPDVVNDVFICAKIEDVDGAGGVLGFAGPEWLRDTGTQLPFIGTMTFDSTDVDALIAEGSFEGVVVSFSFVCLPLCLVGEIFLIVSSNPHLFPNFVDARNGACSKFSDSFVPELDSLRGRHVTHNPFSSY
jgi:hypothetical protein